MKIALLSTLSEKGSTAAGRVLPLAFELCQIHNIHLLWPTAYQASNSKIHFHQTGTEPFSRSKNDKVRLRGLRLVQNMLSSALSFFFTLIQIKPDVIIIFKTHPQNVLATWLYIFWHKTASLFKIQADNQLKIILDVDDFELMANKVTSLVQRGAIHWSEHIGARISHHITAASPFLSDHFALLTSHQKPVTLIPTGINARLIKSYPPAPSKNILYIGSLSESSGHLISLLPPLLHHLKKSAPDLTLTIAGDGHDINKLKAQFKSLNLLEQVIWLGRFANSDLPEILSQTKIILDPIDAGIVARAKSSYRVLLAASSGLPVVTSNIGLRPLLLPRALHPRFFAEPSDAKSYAKLVMKIIQQSLTPEESALLRQHARQFTWKKISHQYHQLLSELNAS